MRMPGRWEVDGEEDGEGVMYVAAVVGISSGYRDVEYVFGRVGTGETK